MTSDMMSIHVDGSDHPPIHFHLKYGLNCHLMNLCRSISIVRVEGGRRKTTIFRNAHKRYKYLFNINNRAVQTRTVRLADSRGMRNNVFGTEAAPDTTTFATSSRYYVTRYILSRKLVLRARVFFFARSPQLECHYGNTKSNCALL